MDHPLKSGGKFFRYLNGTDGFFWKGMATRTDLGAQPTDHPRYVLNGRYYGGRIVARRPLVDPVASVPVIDALDLIGDGIRRWMPAFVSEHHSYRAVRMWLGGWGAGFTGGHIATIDTDTDPEYLDLADYYHEINFPPRIERFANFVYVGEYNALRRIYQIDRIIADPWGVDYTARNPNDEVVVAFPGYLVTALHLHEGKLYFAITDPYDTITGFVYSWDGFQITQEYELPVTGAGGVAMGTFRDHLLVAVGGWGTMLVKDSSGTWTAVPLGGFLPNGMPNSIATVKDLAFIMGSNDAIYSWNGTSLALVHTISGTLPQGGGCAGFNGRFYYGWGDYDGPHGDRGDRYPYIGCYDPDTPGSDAWQDTYKSLSNDNPVWWGEVRGMGVYRQRLVATLGVEDNGTLHTDIMTHVVENNPKSEWYNIRLESACPGPFNVVGGTAMVVDCIKVL